MLRIRLNGTTIDAALRPPPVVVLAASRPRRLAGQVQMEVEDLFAIAGALDMSVHELLDLAESAATPHR